MRHLCALIGGFALDALLGDPYDMPHIIRWIGSLISWTEGALRTHLPASTRWERAAGVLLVLVVGINALSSFIAKKAGVKQ